MRFFPSELLKLYSQYCTYVAGDKWYLMYSLISQTHTHTEGGGGLEENGNLVGENHKSNNNNNYRSITLAIVLCPKLLKIYCWTECQLRRQRCL